jgi:hypothetical protein
LYFSRLKKKWNIISNFQLVIIFIVFGLTGSVSVKFAEPLLIFFKVYPDTFESILGGTILYWIIRVLVVFPIYQILLIIFGAIFLQFRFFWEFEKKILKRMGFKNLFKKN